MRAADRAAGRRRPDVRSFVEVPPRGERFERRRRKLRRRRKRRIALLVVAAVLAPITYSYVTTMVRPSSLPLSVRTIEWIRANHGAWAVNTIEHY